MDRFCGHNPCFFAQERKIEAQIPLIYQYPQKFYFPQQLHEPTLHKQSKKVQNYEFTNGNRSQVMDQNLKRVKTQTADNLWTSQHMSTSNNTSTLPRRQEYNFREVKQNINPRVNKDRQSLNTTHIYFDNQLFRSKSSQKLLTTALKTNESHHNFTQLYPQKQSYQKNAHFDIVPVSEYHSLIQSNHKMKRIIEEEYRPLKNCYQSLRQQQRDRQKLIQLLEYKVKQLGQKLKQRSVNSMNYVSY